jgi:hypothetical protein
MKGCQLPPNQDSVGVLDVHFTSHQAPVALLKALTLIQVKYSKCFSQVAVALRCPQTSIQSKLMRAVTPLPRCLAVRGWAAHQDSQVCFPLCKGVELQGQLEGCPGGISISGSHLLGGALGQLHHQDFNSKSFSQMINQSKKNE